MSLITANTYTDAQLLAQARECVAKILIGQSYSLNGRQMTYADLPDVMKFIDWLESRIEDSETDTGGNIALAKFGDAT